MTAEEMPSNEDSVVEADSPDHVLNKFGELPVGFDDYN